MGLNTRSKFYYIDPISTDNYTINFIEPLQDNLELTAQVDVGSYSPSQLATAIQKALNKTGKQTYSVNFNRADRTYTITGDANFNILGATGTSLANTILTTIGFAAVDLSGSTNYTGPNSSGVEYLPQFLLQDYLGKDDNEEAVESSINESSNGTIEILTYGYRRFVEFNIRPISDNQFARNSQIETDLNATQNARNFLGHIIRKRNIEFMPDRNTVANFDILLLEESTGNNKGVGFKLKELRDLRLQNWYESGKLKFRVIQ